MWPICLLWYIFFVVRIHRNVQSPGSRVLPSCCMVGRVRSTPTNTIKYDCVLLQCMITILVYSFKAPDSCVTCETHSLFLSSTSHLPMGRCTTYGHEELPNLNTTGSHTQCNAYSTTSLAKEGWATERAKKGSDSFWTQTLFDLLVKIIYNIYYYNFNIWYVNHMFILILNLLFIVIKYNCVSL